MRIHISDNVALVLINLGVIALAGWATWFLKHWAPLFLLIFLFKKSGEEE